MKAPKLTKEIAGQRPGVFTETPEEMVRRVTRELGTKRNIVVINDEAHHCYRRRVGADDSGLDSLSGEDKREAAKRDEEARIWLTGLQAVAAKTGVRAAGRPPGTLPIPWLDVAKKFPEELRLALFDVWGQSCRWCRRPLTYAEMEVDHLIPKSLTGSALGDALAQHGLPADYDLDATVNLVPSCRPCNGLKGSRPPPTAPIIATLLEMARRRAPKAEALATSFAGQRELDRALGVIRAAVASGVMTEDARRTLDEAVAFARAAVAAVTGAPAAKLRLHPFHHDPEPPEIVDVTGVVDEDEFLEFLQDWVEEPSARDELAGGFDSSECRLDSAWPKELVKVAYSEETASFLARVRFEIEYTFFGGDSEGPADTDETFDLWVELDDSRTAVLDARLDLMGTFPE